MNSCRTLQQSCTIGDTVKVQVINVAPDGKIALSIKRLLPPSSAPAA